MNNLPKIYLDMDGVLFDFVKNIEKTTGLTIDLVVVVVVVVVVSSSK